MLYVVIQYYRSIQYPDLEHSDIVEIFHEPKLAAHKAYEINHEPCILHGFITFAQVLMIGEEEVYKG